jgi:hypothetical protein
MVITDTRNEREMTMNPIKITAALLAVAIGGGAALATASAAQAYPAADDSIRASSVSAAGDEAPRADGYVTFRSERYKLSDRAIVSTSPTTIRILDDSARTENGGTTSLYVQLGYKHDPMKPEVIRVSSGIAIRGYDFASGTYDESQAIKLGPGTLSIDSPHWSEATHVWGNLGAQNERGIFLDVHGVHFGSPS